MVTRISAVIQGFRSAADGTFPTAKPIIPEILDACPVNIIRVSVAKLGGKVTWVHHMIHVLF